LARTAERQSRELITLLVAVALHVPASLGAQNSAAAPPTVRPQGGRVAGQVVDRSTGRPIPGAQISLPGFAGTTASDLDGRYRTVEVPAGYRSLQARMIGYQVAQIDSIVVKAGEAVIANVALTPTAVQLEELVAEGAPVKASDEAGLLAMQQAAPTVTDGVSAEQISRSPDSDASDAVARIPGVSVVGEYVYVRGLGERYGNTLLNGVELPSPEPTKKVVPLDIFPASLLEDIVTVKAGRPDRPGDLTGALVEIETKEFPENRVLQLNLKGEYNTNATWRTVQRADRNGLDFLGFDDGRRSPQGEPPIGETISTPEAELFMESIRDVWRPSATAPLNVGGSFNLGGTISGGANPLGGILSLNYSGTTEYLPNRLYQISRSQNIEEPPVLGFQYRQTGTLVDWGGILSFTQRFGSSSKLSLKNIYSRNTEETFLEYRGFNTDNDVTDNSLGFQAVYIERSLFQTQLAGEHFFRGLGSSRLEWRGAYARAQRDEPENRSLLYQFGPDGTPRFIPFKSNFFFVRNLDDRLLSGQVDWAVPLSVYGNFDGEVKAGAIRREKQREFKAATYAFSSQFSGADDRLLELSPEDLFTPENIGQQLIYRFTAGPRPGGGSGESIDPSYDATDRLTGAYVMADLPILRGVRFAGGLRFERWRLYLFNGGKENTLGDVVEKANDDLLPSANLIIGVGQNMNLRFSGWRSVARPEARELSPAFYAPVAGECGVYGNPDIERTSILNADARWEWYPESGEILEVSAFYKYFDKPIFEQVGFATATDCQIIVQQADNARNVGIEAEVRKRLDVLTPALRDFTAAINFTYVNTTSLVTLDLPDQSVYELRRPFVGQSPYIVNASLGYIHPRGGFTATVLYNYFDDRVNRYGEVLPATQPDGSLEVQLIPDIVEVGRSSLDFKVQQRVGNMTVAAAGRNLLNAQVRFVQRLEGGDVIANAFYPGVDFSLAVGYEF
jgi:hypothetical protein